MANYAVLKAAINAVIKTNGNKEITGQVLNQTLMAIVDSLGENYQFAGVAVPSTNPGTPDQNIFYLATQAGTYTNFGATVLPAGISMLEWKNNTWSSETFFTIDDAPTAGSGNLVKSGGVKTAIDNVAFSTNEKVKDVGIDSTPTSGSDNLIKSGAVFDAFKNDGGAYDVSVHFPTGGVEGGNTYTLDGAVAMVPQNMRKGGMSIKFIQSSDNKYIQARCMAEEFTTDVTKWQGVDNVVEAGSNGLANGGAIIEEISKFADYTKTAITPYSTSDNYALTGNGKCVSDNNSRMKKYNVTAGNILYLNLSKDNGGVYQFQNDGSVPSAGTNNALIGKPINNYSKGFVTVPTGATWLIVSELKTNSTNYVGVYHKPTSLNLAIKSCVGGRLIGKKLSGEDGTALDDTTKYVTPYIKVNPGDKVIRSGSDYLYTYDASLVKNHYYSTSPVTIPSDAVYIRVSLPVDGTGYLEVNGVRLWDDTIAIQQSAPSDILSALKGWILGECMTVTGLDKNSDDAITQVRGNWPDGSYGTMTITRNADNLATQVVAVWLGTSYTLSIARDADGNVTATSFS